MSHTILQPDGLAQVNRPPWTELVSLEEIRQRPPVARYGIWGDTIAKGERVMISGPQKRAHKTWFTQELALSLAAGIDFLEQSVPEPLSVILVNAEMGADHYYQRLRAIAERCPELWDAKGRLRVMNLCGSGINLGDPGDAKLFVDTILEAGADVVIIDPISECSQVDENSSAEVGKLLRQTQDPLAVKGITTILVHHWSKGNSANAFQGGEKARGSAKWGEHQDCNLQAQPDGTSGIIELSAQLRNAAAPEPIRIRLEHERLTLVASGTKPRIRENVLDFKVLEYLREHGETRQSDLQATLDAAATPLSRTVKRLVAKGRVASRKGDTRNGEDGRSHFLRSTAEKAPREN